MKYFDLGDAFHNTQQIFVLTGHSSNLCEACRKQKRHSFCALAIFIFVSESNAPLRQKAVACPKHFSKAQYCFLNFLLKGLDPSEELFSFCSSSCVDVAKRLILSFPRILPGVSFGPPPCFLYPGVLFAALLLVKSSSCFLM